ncbi:MAG TPA: glycosyltransferase family 1 protein [Streptosporangiaceae bacterium]|nr:glycosyltransferase family 1 protein [Streptosporangiaceae bacterium]
MTSRALVYGDIDLNLIDGSAIWLQSVTQALARAGCAVTLVLKAPVRTSRLIAPLLAEPGITVRRPFEEHLLDGLDGTSSLRPPAAVELLTQLDTDQPYELVVLRGRAVTLAAARSEAFAGRLWPYLTDVPQSVPGLTPDGAAELELIASSARYLLCQTEELRCFLEGSLPAACGKCVLLPPMLADIPAARGAEAAGSPLRLVYTGKFAPRWNTLEMTGLPALLAARGVASELHMAGDKIHDDPSGYQQRMRAALDTEGVTWHGGQSREDAMRLAASCDIGLSWRHPDLDASLELSTKVLEFGALGLPVILNRTPMHEALLGADYPLFAASLADVVDVAAAAAADEGLYRLAADRTSRAAEQFALDRAAERLRGYVARGIRRGGSGGRTAPPSAGGSGGSSPRASTSPLRVVVAGHDLKFFTPLLSYLRMQPDLEVRLDQWAALGKHDPAASRELAAWADVVVCEWCGPNAVWYSRHKRRGSRLLVRLHRFELRSPYPGQLKIGAVNQVVCVSKHYARLTREYTGWPDTKVATVPNALDVAQLDRPKLDGAGFHLGMVGMVPSRKRFDLALDVLEELRREDDRYMLFVKSGMPWEHWWVWQDPAEREHYADALRRVQRSPLLRGAVVFDDAGPDVPTWLRRVGFMLSTSDDESFHVAPAEGMASRAVPVLRHWPGAETIYDMRWIHRGPAEMAAAVLALAGEDGWRAAGDAAHAQAAAAFNLNLVCESWHSLLTADLDPAVPGPILELLGSG